MKTAFTKINKPILKFEKSINLSDKPATLCEANEDKNARCVVSYACPETVTADHLARFHVKNPDETKVIEIISFSQYDTDTGTQNRCLLHKPY